MCNIKQRQSNLTRHSLSILMELAGTRISTLEFTGATKGDGGGGGNSRAIRRAKLQSKYHHLQTNIQFFTGQMPFLLPNQRCHSTHKRSHDMINEQ